MKKMFFVLMIGSILTAQSQDYKNLYTLVKQRARFQNVTFYTKTGEEIASRRGGVQLRQEFFNSVLDELSYCRYPFSLLSSSFSKSGGSK